MMRFEEYILVGEMVDFFFCSSLLLYVKKDVACGFLNFEIVVVDVYLLVCVCMDFMNATNNYNCEAFAGNAIAHNAVGFFSACMLMLLMLLLLLVL